MKSYTAILVSVESSTLATDPEKWTEEEIELAKKGTYYCRILPGSSNSTTVEMYVRNILKRYVTACTNNTYMFFCISGFYDTLSVFDILKFYTG